MSELAMDGAAAPAAEPVASNVIDTAPSPVGAEPAAAPDLDAELSAIWDKHNVNGAERAPDGKFVSIKDATAPDEVTEVTAPPEPAVEPPNSWTAEAKANWGKLERATQDYILQRETEAAKAIEANTNRVKSFEPVERAIAQHQAYLQQKGMSPDRAFDMLIRAQMHFDADPMGAATAVLRSYGIDLPALLSGQQSQVPTQDPALMQRLSQLEGAIHQQRQATESERMADANAQIEEFAKDKPYFADVRNAMGTLMNGGLAADLQSAYDMAVHALPNIRERIQADQRKAELEAKKAEDAKKAEESAKRAADAQKAARLNVRSSSAIPNPKSVDDTLAEIAARHYG